MADERLDAGDGRNAITERQTHCSAFGPVIAFRSRGMGLNGSDGFGRHPCLVKGAGHGIRDDPPLFIMACDAVGVTEVCAADHPDVIAFPALPLQNNRTASLAEDEAIPLPVKWPVEGRGEGFETLETVEAEVVVQIVTDHQRPLDSALPDHQRRVKQRIGA